MHRSVRNVSTVLGYSEICPWFETYMNDSVCILVRFVLAPVRWRFILSLIA